MSNQTELQQLKYRIEEGDSCVYAYEQIDLDKMIEEGDGPTAFKISQVLILVSEINDTAGVE